MKRTANAIWIGTGKEGKGSLSTQSTTLNKTQYSYQSRFENGVGTNPEELIGAAHAGCFAMKLSFVLQGMNLTAESLDVQSEITLDNGAITLAHLILKAKIPGITPAQFTEATADAKQNCPISKLFNTTITLDASLV